MPRRGTKKRMGDVPEDRMEEEEEEAAEDAPRRRADLEQCLGARGGLPRMPRKANRASAPGAFGRMPGAPRRGEMKHEPKSQQAEIERTTSSQRRRNARR